MTAETWTIQRVLNWTQEHFAAQGIESSRLDAELLLADVLRQERLYLYTHFDQPLSAEERGQFRERVKRRAKHEPVAYILGVQEFYGRPFAVTPDVLIPRPETEHLIEACLCWIDEHKVVAPRILDVGTGSGCVAATVALECQAATVVACDISAPALTLARSNADALGAAVRFVESDLLRFVEQEPQNTAYDVILSNPPYIERDANLPDDVARYEPSLALFAGDAGLDVIKRLVHEAPPHLASPGVLMFEMGAGQSSAVQELVPQEIEFVADLQGHRRVAVISFP